MKYLFLLFFSFFFINTYSQGFRDRVLNKNWILTNTRIDTCTVLSFEKYDSSKVEINTMIWNFLPNGRIQYDYQSNSDVEACLGVEFLDLDPAASSWRWDSQRLILILQMKGGFASLDDFLIKNEYQVHFQFTENQMTGFALKLSKPILFKILNTDYVKP
jgi:hypothetical protein